MTDVNKFNELIPTAILTAYPRTLTDIPLYPEVFEEVKKLYGQQINPELLIESLAPELEARHKIIDLLLRETGITQVLEIGAGFSPRGLNATGSHLVAQYVELDLSELAVMKQKIVDHFAGSRQNLHILGGNALNQGDFEQASSYFDKSKPVAVINEGLLRYLNFDEKKLLADNIKSVLNEFGGVWITGDGSKKKFRNRQNQNIRGMNTTILNQTKRNDLGNAFDNQQQMIEFYENLGFMVQPHDYAVVIDQLVSPKKLGVSREEVRDKLLSYASAKVLKLKDGRDE